MARRFIDLSIFLENDVITDPPFMRPRIEHVTHGQTMPEANHSFPGVAAEQTRGSGTPALASCSAAPSPVSIRMVSSSVRSTLAGCERWALAIGPPIVPRAIHVAGGAAVAGAARRPSASQDDASPMAPRSRRIRTARPLWRIVRTLARAIDHADGRRRRADRHRTADKRRIVAKRHCIGERFVAGVEILRLDAEQRRFCREELRLDLDPLVGRATDVLGERALVAAQVDAGVVDLLVLVLPVERSWTRSAWVFSSEVPSER